MASQETKTMLMDGTRSQDSADMKFVLFLEASRENMIERVQKRAAETAGARSDDNMEVLIKRFDTFVQTSMPIVEQYEKLGLVRRVDANRDPNLVYDDIKKLFKE